MKKVFIIILSCLLIILVISFLKIHITSVDNQNITNKIKKLKQTNKKIDKDNLDTENEINSLKEEKQKAWEELESWQKTKAKLEKALPQ